MNHAAHADTVPSPQTPINPEACRTEYWLRWDSETTVSELVALPLCPARNHNDDLCTLFADHPGDHNHNTADGKTTETGATPPPEPGRGNVDYLAHRHAALAALPDSRDPAQVHAALAIAAAVTRLADLLHQTPNQ